MLGFFELMELGQSVEKQLVRNDVKDNNLLRLEINEELFSKIDEDIYYRQNLESDGKEFKPSENEITINFEHLTIKLIKKVA